MRLLIILVIFVIGCTIQKPVHNLSKEEVVKMHDKYLEKMGLSKDARAELTGIVTMFYDKISQQGEPLTRTKGRKFKDMQDWLKTHQGYFDMLGISAKTQEELLKAMSILWDKMQNDPNDELVVAVKKMMEKFNGMPPCCSEDVLERASKKKGKVHFRDRLW